MTNDDRADRALRCLDDHYQAHGMSPEPLRDCITDLLTDLLHLAAQQCIDISECQGAADDHYSAELSEEQE